MDLRLRNSIECYIDCDILKKDAGKGMKIKYLVMDVDGTLTDGNIYISDNGELFKSFNVKDGYGIHDLITTKKVTPIIITGRKSAILEHRCRELGITKVYQGVRDKKTKLREILKAESNHYFNVAYIGDDLNDLECMKQIKNEGGQIGCPADASKEIIKIVDFVSEKNGGHGAVREFIDWIITNGGA